MHANPHICMYIIIEIMNYNLQCEQNGSIQRQMLSNEQK